MSLEGDDSGIVLQQLHWSERALALKTVHNYAKDESEFRLFLEALGMQNDEEALRALARYDEQQLHEMRKQFLTAGTRVTE